MMSWRMSQLLVEALQQVHWPSVHKALWPTSHSGSGSGSIAADVGNNPLYTELSLPRFPKSILQHWKLGPLPFSNMTWTHPFDMSNISHALHKTRHLSSERRHPTKHTTARTLLQTHDNILRGWTHNMQQSTIAADNSTTDQPHHVHHAAHAPHVPKQDFTSETLLTISMSALCSCLITIFCIFRVYGWHRKRTQKQLVTPSAVCRIGSVDAIHNGEQKPVVGSTYT